MAKKTAFMQLSSCWGCHQSLLNAHLGLLPILPNLEIIYWPAVVDFKIESLKAREDQSVVLGFLEGCVRTEADRENVLLMRKKCKILVALGNCANHGSVAGLANVYETGDLLKYKFQDVPSIGTTDVTEGFPNDYERISPITDRIYTVPQLVDIEVKLPGCPPRTENIISAVAYLLGLVAPEPENKNVNISVCDTCSLNAVGCFLDKGEMCFGPITAGGCNLKCPDSGDPCVGCFKATSNVGQGGQELLNLASSSYGFDRIKAVDIKKFLELYLGLANLGHLYFKGDPIQRLHKEPSSFAVKMVGEQSAIVIKQTGIELIDDLLGLLLFKLRDSPEFKFMEQTVCAHCDRELTEIAPELKRDYEGLPSMEICLLKQGYICMGPATQAGCGTQCPNNANAPCLGCYGPPDKTPDQGALFLSQYPSVKGNILDKTGLLYRFSVAASPVSKAGKYSKGE